jgi:hypothetical protein
MASKELRAAILAHLKSVPGSLNRDEFTQWAVDAMQEFQELLDDVLGLHGYAVVGQYPNDHWLDEIAVRLPWGEERTVHGFDVYEEDEPGDAAYATLVDFFAKLRDEHDVDPLARAITRAVYDRLPKDAV